MKPCAIALVLLLTIAAITQAVDKPIKTFVLAGQSNMVGWGDSTKLPEVLRNGSDRVLMFENGRWQPLRPHEKVNRNQQRFGMTEFHFGPEIAFAHEMAKAWPDETIGIIKHAVGGTSVLTWQPDWSKEEADRVNQGQLGSLYKRLMRKVNEAKETRDIEIVGFLWLQGGGDMKQVDIAKEYLGNLQEIVLAVRNDTGVSDLPFYFGSPRQQGIPDDLSDLKPELMEGRYPAAQWVLKAQFDAQQAIPHARMVILRDIEKHPMNVHYNTAGQLEVGRLFASAVRNTSGNAERRIGGRSPRQILSLLGAKGEAAVQPSRLEGYRRVFGFIDHNKDGNLSMKEFVEDGRYMTRQARQGIFSASDDNEDGIVSQQEYVTNRIITDEAKAIMAEMDEDGDGHISQKEFVRHCGLPEVLSLTVFNEFDTDSNGELLVPEYLRVWGRWARGLTVLRQPAEASE